MSVMWDYWTYNAVVLLRGWRDTWHFIREHLVAEAFFTICGSIGSAVMSLILPR